MVELHQKYRIMFENMVQGVFYQLADGTLSDVNPAALKMFGLTYNQFMGRTSYDPEWHVVREDGTVIPPDQHPSMIALRTGVPVRGMVVGVNNPMIDQIVWLEVNAIPMFMEEERIPYQVFVTLHDITDQKTSEILLKESEARFRNLLQCLPNIAVQGYGPDGTVHYWNRANEKIYGYTEEEALGRNILDLIIPPEMRDDVRQAIRTGAETGDMPPAAELLLMRKDGSRVPVFSSHAVVMRAGCEPELFCIDIDFSELKKAESVLR